MKKIKLLIIIIGTMSLSINSFALFGGGDGSDYWQMKTFFESVSINAQTLKSLNAQIKEIERQIELAKKLPDNVMNNHISQYQDTIKTLVSITNSTKSVLKDAKKAEVWFEDVYEMANNRNYKNLLDKFTNSLNSLSYDSMKTSGMANASVKSTTKNAETLMNMTKNSTNIPQLLEVLSGWSSNLSTQINTITEV